MEDNPLDEAAGPHIKDDFGTVDSGGGHFSSFMLWCGCSTRSASLVQRTRAGGRKGGGGEGGGSFFFFLNVLQIMRFKSD